MSPVPAPGEDARIARSALVVFVLFVLLQGSLSTMGVRAGDRANIWWWTALSTLAARDGFFNVWTPYPPIFAVMHYGLVKAFGADTDLLARYFFEGDRSAEAVSAFEITHAAMKGIWGLFNAVFLAAQALLVCALARRWMSRKEAWVAAAAYVLLNLTWSSQIVVGLTCDQFEYFPGFFFLLGLYLLIEGKETGSALAAGAGIMIKIYPGLLLPLAWGWVGSARRALAYTVVAIAVCVVVASPFLVVRPDIFLSTYQWSASRPGWETIWVYDSDRPSEKPFPPMPVPAAMIGLFDSPPPETLVVLADGRAIAGGRVVKKGSRIVLESPDGRVLEFEPEQVKAIQHPRVVEWKYRALMGLTIALLLGLAWVFREALRRPEGLIRGALLFVLVFLFFSKGFSSYFILWFLPLVFALYRPVVASLWFCVFLLVGNLEFAGGLATLPYYWASIFLRHLLILGLGLEQVWRMRELAAKARRREEKN